jgi:hypothetical protein
MPAAYHYTVYGLHLTTDRPLPEVLPSSSPVPDQQLPVTIYWVEEISALPTYPSLNQTPYYAHPAQDEHGVPVLQVWRDKTFYSLVYLNGNRFVVSRDGAAVWAICPQETDFGFVTAQILGPILGLVLRLRGSLVLHASVVSHNDQALAILGASGSGKSTTAAELCRQGCRALSDDIAALFFQDGKWWVQPGYPRLRLWPHTAETLYGPEHNLRPIAPGDTRWDKRYLELDTGLLSFVSSPRPLRAVYALDWSKVENDTIQIKTLNGAPGLAVLDANSYMEYLLDRLQRERQMAAIAKLLGTIPVYRVQPIPKLSS